MSYQVKLEALEIKTLITIIDHVRSQAANNGASGYGIDMLCRKDCANRWNDLRIKLASYIGGASITEKSKT